MLGIRKITVGLLAICGALPFALAEEPMVKEIPFEAIYSEGYYTHYIGSQIVKGELTYKPDELYGYYFDFSVDSEDASKIPVLQAPLGPVKNFILNGFIDMHPEEIAIALEFLGIPQDLAEQILSPDFTKNECSLSGPVTLQITNIDFGTPPDSEYFAEAEGFRTIKSGPLDISCTTK